MGCGGNSNQRGGVELPKPLTIHGHIMDNQTRSLMAICDKAEVKYQMNKINPINNENIGVRYLDLNPTGHIPMIEDGTYRVLGGNHIIFVYLCKAKSSIGQRLLPGDLEQATKGVLGWYHAKLSTPVQQLFKMVYQPEKLANKGTLAQFEKNKKEVLGALPAIEKRLLE